MRIKLPFILKALFIIPLFALLLANKGYSQNVSLNFKYVSIDTILKEIKKQTNLNYIPGDKKIDSVSIYVIDMSLPEALAVLLNGRSYSYEIYSDYFVITDKIPGVVEKSKDSADEGRTILGPPPADVTGKVIDQDGKPIAGTDIQMLQSNIITETDKQGNFILKKVRVEGGFEITHKDYETRRYFMIGETNLSPIVLQRKK